MISMCKITWKNRGSITVEASIVIPIIILSIAAVIYMGLLLYQRTLIQSAADKAAQMGAAVWKNRSADTGTGKIGKDELDNSGLYWRIIDTGNNEKIDKIVQLSESFLEKNNLLHPISSNVTAGITDYIVYKRLQVNVENSYRIPGGKLLRIFGANDRFTVRVKSFSVIDDPSELIRETDFIIDIEKELEDKYPVIKNLGEKTRDVFGDIKGKIGSFLN